jgi:hypothetical protein
LLGGQEVPIDAGVKLTGTVGRTDVGFLGVRTGDLINAENVLIVSEKNFVVGRVKRNLLQQSYIGAIFTSGHPAEGQSGQTIGADVRLATSHFLGRSNNFVVNGYAVKGMADGALGAGALAKAAAGRDWSYGFTAHYPNDKFNAQIAYREIQENFKPGLGFVQRDNVRLFRIAGSYNPRPKDFLNVLQMFHDVYYTRFTRLDNGEVESWDLYVTLLDWHLTSGEHPRDVRFQSDLRAAVRAVRDLARGFPPAGRVPLHTLPQQPAVYGHEAATVGQCQPDVWRLLVRERGAGDGEPHLQGSAAVHHLCQHQPDVRAPAGR